MAGVPLNGRNFVDSLVNNRLEPAKYYDEHRLGVMVQGKWMPGPGTYPLVVIHPGSAGAVSNQFYLIVKP